MFQKAPWYIADGVPPMLQQRHPPTALEGLPGMPRPAQSYRYVILHLWIITITRRSISLGIAAASLTFVAFQASASDLLASLQQVTHHYWTKDVKCFSLSFSLLMARTQDLCSPL
jgi:hypothetical protein